MDATSSQARQVIARYSSAGRSSLSLADFDKLVHDLRSHQGGGAPRSPHGGAVVDATVRAAFEAFDADGSGGIDAKELRQALAHLGMQADAQGVTAVLRKYDADGNANLGLEEFARLVNDIRRYQGKEAATARSPTRPGSAHRGARGGLGTTTTSAVDPHIRAAFEAFDEDGSGDIDRYELIGALKQVAPARPPPRGCHPPRATLCIAPPFIRPCLLHSRQVAPAVAPDLHRPRSHATPSPPQPVHRGAAATPTVP